MNLTLYHNSSERKVIGKSLNNLGDVTGVIKGDASIMAPTFILEYDSTASSDYLTDVNYLYWQEAGRYYFVDDVQVLTGKRVMFMCSVDVLQTYRYAIKQQTAIISKQQNSDDSNIYYNDGSFVTDSRNFYTIKSFSNGFNDDGDFILVTAGA